MKKALKMLLVSALVATMFSSVALAEINVGAWGRALFVPAYSNFEGETVTRETASWYNNSRLGFTLSGTSDNVGVQADLFFDGGGTTSMGDQGKIWIKPIDIVTVSVGPSIFFDDLRGNAAYGSWNWWRSGHIHDEDVIFDRLNVGLKKNDSTGAAADVGGFATVVQTAGITVYMGLDINEQKRVTTAAVDAVPATDPDGVPNSGDETAAVPAVEEVAEVETAAMTFQRGQYGAGYAIAGIGLIRAQYIGAYWVDPSDNEEAKNYGILNAAVKIDQIMPALYVDLGFFMPTDSDQADPEKNRAGGLTDQYTRVAAYVKYAMAPMTFHLSSDIWLGSYDAEGNDATGIRAGVGFDMDLGGGLGLVTDFRYANAGAGAGADKDGKARDMVWSTMAGVEKGFSNGKIGIAAQLNTGNFAGSGDNVGKEEPEDMAWAIPVKAEYWF